MQDKILLNDLLQLTSDEIEKTKIKLNITENGIDPLDVYLENPYEFNTEWLFWRTKTRNFNVGQLAINMVRMNEQTWLLTTIKKVTKENDKFNGINYEGVEVDSYKKYFGRIKIKFRKQVIGNTFYFKTIMSNLEVLEILPVPYDGDYFPGYDNINISFSKLKNIIIRSKRDWIAALENQKGVYLIMDKLTGKGYVGSATGDGGMLLQRWMNYLHNGHGDNEGLRDLISKNGIDYAKNNYQFILLENYNSITSKEFILSRENWWKKALLTSEFGYNRN